VLDQQEQERFVRLWADVQPAVEHYVRALIRDPVSAKDLLQETALVLFRRFKEYDGQRPFLGWALGVARLQVLSFHRDESRSFVTFDTELLDRFTETWTQAAPQSHEKAAALELCLERLGARPKEILRLRYFEELTSDEIAQRIGSRAGAIRVMLQRVREQLRSCVEHRLRAEGRTL
jgi:RNA polymerase sigma-70 factor, ECF subfamily